MFHFHKYEKLNKKVYTKDEALFGDKLYKIFNLSKCRKCDKLQYNLVCRHFTNDKFESMDYERKLRNLKIESNMDYLLSR